MPLLPEPSVLELRIHGVKNTLPGAMLGVKETDVSQVDGDEQGGYWVAAHDTKDRSRHVRREAYSWGLLARTGGKALPLLGQLAVHIGWLFILPFGLCNVAYWTRRMTPQRIRNGWIPGRGGALVRVFALGLTLLYVCALAAVALDLIAIQCFTPDGVCAQLPSFLDPLAGVSRGLRLAVLSVVPLAGMLLLYVLARRGRVQYEASVNKMANKLAAHESEAAPTLATPGFWSKARVGPTTERLHFAAVLLLLTVLLAWDRVYSLLPECADPDGFLRAGCAGPGAIFGSSPANAIIGGLALLALLAVTALVAVAADTPASTNIVRTRRRAAGLLLAGGILLFVVNAVIGAFPASGSHPTGGAARFLGLVATPNLLLVSLLAIALSGLGWRRGVPPWLSFALLTAALVLLALPHVASDEPAFLDVLWQALAAALVIAQLVAVVVFGARDRAEHARTAWNGAGPGVVLLLALGATMLLTSLLVVGTARWLGSGPPPPTAGIFRPSYGQPTVLRTPDAYVEFGVILLAMLLAEGIVAVALVAIRMARLPALASASVRDGGREVAPLPAYRGREPVHDPSEDRVVVRVLRARRFAALAQRGEPLLGVVATVIGIGVSATLLLDVRVGAGSRWSGWLQLSDPAQNLAVTVLGAAALGAVAAVAANALTNKERPVGLLWDLICFLPRAGHPFGPPSYAERVVPELNDRIERWLGDPLGPNRKVILSAHSLGTILAIATLFARYAVVEQPLRRIGLITYGAQPRAYFGRFFPELFGPRVLGTRSTLGPTLRGADPWVRQIRLDQTQAQETYAGPVIAPTLCDLLDHRGHPAWVSLWRRTDFLGFPVHSYSNAEENVIDRGASEMEPGPYERVATHSNYPATTQYAAAFREVDRRLLT